MKTASPRIARASRQSGFTIVEMMVALAISMIVLLGFSVIFVNIKKTFISQDALSQLQDNERLAMTLLTASANEAGYYPTPATLSSAQIKADADATYGAMVASQAVMGTDGASGASDTISMAFAASANDTLITCQGHTIVAADIAAAPSVTNASVSVRNVFYVDATNKTLNCIAKINGGTSATYGGGAGTPLVTNVASMSVLYGVDGGAGSVAGYYTATNVTDWTTVKTARITLNFVNPNSTTTIPWVQTINLMNN